MSGSSTADIGTVDVLPSLRPCFYRGEVSNRVPSEVPTGSFVPALDDKKYGALCYMKHLSLWKFSHTNQKLGLNPDLCGEKPGPSDKSCYVPRTARYTFLYPWVPVLWDVSTLCGMYTSNLDSYKLGRSPFLSYLKAFLMLRWLHFLDNGLCLFRANSYTRTYIVIFLCCVNRQRRRLINPLLTKRSRTLREYCWRKNGVFVAPWGSCKNQCFGGTCRLHLQGRRNKRGKKRVSNWLTDITDCESYKNYTVPHHIRRHFS
jgi:hypothetical protein